MKRLIIILIALILIAPGVYAHHSSVNLESITDNSKIVEEGELVEETDDNDSDDDPLTRGEVAKKMVDELGVIPEYDDTGFEDTEIDWDADSIEALPDAGVVKGYDDEGIFKPETETALKELNLILTDFGMAEKTSGIIRDLSSSIDASSEGISEFEKEMQMRNLEDLRSLISNSRESDEERESALALVEQVQMFFDNPMIKDIDAKEPGGIEEVDSVQRIRQGISEVRQILDQINSENKEATQFEAMSLLKEIKSFTDSAKLDEEERESFDSQIEKLKFLIRSAESPDVKKARLIKKKATVLSTDELKVIKRKIRDISEDADCEESDDREERIRCRLAVVKEHGTYLVSEEEYDSDECRDLKGEQKESCNLKYTSYRKCSEINEEREEVLSCVRKALGTENNVKEDVSECKQMEGEDRTKCEIEVKDRVYDTIKIRLQGLQDKAEEYLSRGYVSEELASRLINSIELKKGEFDSAETLWEKREIINQVKRIWSAFVETGKAEYQKQQEVGINEI